ncbi:MAG TPA: CoA transferase [Solirubrobacteraceae bacterium]|jgi:crotonobetainyl-CoA:carnitine CoA-transferase CaiB-like acyl-CoA transferase|nr:CoA transferase [Solirubrobacteraceae bacterium]
MSAQGPLAGLRVVEIADETAEYCGLMLMGLGAEVIKVEPPDGGATRRIGPFAGDDASDLEGSLYFWHYNRGKRSVTIDLGDERGRDTMLALVGSADVLLRSVTPTTLDLCGLDPEELARRHPELVDARMSPFGEDGPWAHYKGSDLVHLALGGVMANCGYDREPGDGYDLPPVAPAMWHAYHIAGEQLAMGVLAALINRLHTRLGQAVTCAVHEAIAKNTEIDVMNWVMLRMPTYRQTCRHASEAPNDIQTIASTKDGRWYMSMVLGGSDIERTLEFAAGYGVKPGGTLEERVSEGAGRSVPGTTAPDQRARVATETAQRLIRQFRYGRLPWRAAQDAGLLWVPLRRPEENLEDEHWWARGTFERVEHPERGESYAYPVNKWVSEVAPWRAGERAPRLGEHTAEVLGGLTGAGPAIPQPRVRPRLTGLVSRRGRPFAIEDVKILDFGWFLASAGGTRFLNAFGAQSIKVEWATHPDTRMAAMAPVGGREARRVATAPLQPVHDANMGGQFNNKNPGKLGLALNVRHPRGLEIAKELVRVCDIVAEGFSPGVMDRWGLGYDVMRELNPRIIYIQQSGMGQKGTYGRFRTLGPIAASISGISEMSGLPEPAIPAGWGYSYLDWIGAYSFAQALLSALYRRDVTGEGQYIDASQVESGLFVAGTTFLDHQVNGRRWARYGNRSPHKPAAPSGAYAGLGEDRWLAVSCHTEDEWRALATVAGRPEWLEDPRFATLDARLANQDELDVEVGGWVAGHDPSALMEALQEAGVPAGLVQTAEDRCDGDPQLAHLEWLTEVTGAKIGTWPVAEVPARLSRTPAHIGGRLDRGAPCYGEDSDFVLREYLGVGDDEIASLRDEGVIE